MNIKKDSYIRDIYYDFKYSITTDANLPMRLAIPTSRHLIMMQHILPNCVWVSIKNDERIYFQQIMIIMP